MIELIGGLPDRVVGLRASGMVTREDYERLAIPAVRAALDAHSNLRLLYVLGEDLEGYTLGAMWDDTKLGEQTRHDWERIGVATAQDWVRNAVRAFGWMMSGEVRVFDDQQAATAWITEGLDDAGG